MSESEWFIVPNLSEFTDRVRAIVYNNFGSWNYQTDEEIILEDIKNNEKEDFDKVLSHQESLVIVKENIKKEKNKITKKIRYVLSDEMFSTIVNKLNERMVSNIIGSLVKKGLVETAFDDKSNDFIFWVKDDQKENEKPETD